MVAVAGVVLGSAAQAVTGFGFSLVSVPLLVVATGPAAAVRVANLLAMLVNGLILARDHRTADVRRAGLLLAPALVVAPMTAYVVHRTRPGPLSVVVGVLIVLSAVALASGRRVRSLAGGRGLVAAGAVSAAMNTTSGVGGPAVAMYAVNADWPAAMSRPTMQLYFLALNIVSLAALGPVSIAAAVAAVLVLAVVAGHLLGARVVRYLSPTRVGHVVLVLAVAGGVASVARGLIR